MSPRTDFRGESSYGARQGPVILTGTLGYVRMAVGYGVRQGGHVPLGQVGGGPVFAVLLRQRPGATE